MSEDGFLYQTVRDERGVQQQMPPVRDKPAGRAQLAPLSASARTVVGGWKRVDFPDWLYLVGVCMADDRVGFAVGSYGRVLRTDDGGANWGEWLGANDAWHYDCDTFPGGGVLVVGFDNRVETNQGVVRWSDDGYIFGPRTSLFNGQYEPWLHTVAFSDPARGMIVPSSGGLFVTGSGPAQTGDWSWRFPVDGWWNGTATALADGRMWVSGTKIAASIDFGQTWTLQASAEPGLNGPIAIDASGHGFTGNGTIYPEAKGAVYATSNGGASWSAPVLQTPYPIRAIALEPGRGTSGLIFAAGGDYDKGAIWASADGGQSWVLQVYTNVELHDIEAVVVPQASLVDVIAVGHNQIWRGRFALDGRLIAP